MAPRAPTQNDELIYENTQIGYVTGTAMAVGTAITYLAFVAEYGRLGLWGTLFTGGFAIGTALFASLTVRVDRDTLRFHFGPGFWTKEIPIDDIRSVQAVRNSAWWGFGIRFTPKGWLYNVSGLDAVEIARDDGSTIRVGTDEPDALVQAIEQAR
jgi:hypothetical protein